MKIGIDARLWYQSGVGRYIRNLCVNLEKIDKNNSYTLFVLDNDKEKIRGEIKNDNWRIVSANVKWHSVNEQIKLGKIIEKENLDLVHFPYFSLPIFYKKPYVVTIHDLIQFHFATGQASTHPIWLYGFKMLSYRLVINTAARKSKKIIAVSRATKREIVDHLKIDPEKIEVIYEGADDFSNDSSIKPRIEKYILYVGNIFPHKNVENLVKAFEVFAVDKDIKLVFVGKKDDFYKELMNKIPKPIKDKVLFLGEVTDSELSSLYSNAICYIRPSFMEGFSLPPLEAMARNCPVMISDIPVHREIFKENVWYFDAHNPADIADKLNKFLVLKDSEKKIKLNKARKYQEEFSWKNSALETLKVYESSLSL